MRTRNIAEDEILALSTRDESHFFDRKALGINGKKAQKIAVAFANADGGEFVVGISDDKEESDPSKRWHGTTKLEDLNGVLQALLTGLSLEQMSVTEYAKAVNVPTFIIQVKDDMLTFPSDVQTIFDNMPVKDKKLFWIEGTTRRFDGYNYFPENPKQMLEWFNTHMG